MPTLPSQCLLSTLTSIKVMCGSPHPHPKLRIHIHTSPLRSKVNHIIFLRPPPHQYTSPRHGPRVLDLAAHPTPSPLVYLPQLDPSLFFRSNSVHINQSHQKKAKANAHHASRTTSGCLLDIALSPLNPIGFPYLHLTLCPFLRQGPLYKTFLTLLSSQPIYPVHHPLCKLWCIPRDPCFPLSNHTPLIPSHTTHFRKARESRSSRGWQLKSTHGTRICLPIFQRLRQNRI
jgi:hypothetical protein